MYSVDVCEQQQQMNCRTNSDAADCELQLSISPLTHSLLPPCCDCMDEYGGLNPCLIHNTHTLTHSAQVFVIQIFHPFWKSRNPTVWAFKILKTQSAKESDVEWKARTLHTFTVLTNLFIDEITLNPHTVNNSNTKKWKFKSARFLQCSQIMRSTSEISYMSDNVWICEYYVLAIRLFI